MSSAVVGSAREPSAASFHRRNAHPMGSLTALEKHSRTRLVLNLEPSSHSAIVVPLVTTEALGVSSARSRLIVVVVFAASEVIGMLTL